jgi:Raf kinase inhibitor-like YbhB/YbcL family protein
MAFELSSESFLAGGDIPVRHTCEGGDKAPALAWRGAPPGTRSFVLIVDDPDAPDPKAPRMTYVHWIAYDLPATTTKLPEGGALPPGARDGLNDWNRPGYGGPCPPIGRHRYFFKLYALDVELGDLGTPTKHEIEPRMKGHVLGHAEIMGTYAKAKNR